MRPIALSFMASLAASRFGRQLLGSFISGYRRANHKASGQERLDEGLKETFPGSDPLSVFQGDEPPVNAQAKWDAAAADAERHGLDIPTRQ